MLMSTILLKIDTNIFLQNLSSRNKQKATLFKIQLYYFLSNAFCEYCSSFWCFNIAH